jgi:hypothetical protein
VTGEGKSGALITSKNRTVNMTRIGIAQLPVLDGTEHGHVFESLTGPFVNQLPIHG